MANKIIHKHSSVVTDGKVKLPTSSQLEYGELAVNYAKDNETISLKNSENEIVEFKSKDYFDEKINNINTILDSKSDKTHKHDLASITTGTITLTGDVTGTITYNGTNAISATTTVGNNSHTHTSANITDSISSNTDITSATTALVQGKAVKGYVDSAVETINSNIESLQKQIDGEVTSWFLEGAPTLTNAPAKDWTTDDEKQRHEGDTYTNINSSAIDHIGNSDIWEQGSTVEKEGLTYEQCKYSHTQRLRTKELLKNSNAKLLANSNWTIFVLYFDENKLYTGNNIGWTTEVTLDASYPYIAILLNKEYTTVTPNDIEFPIRIEGKFDYDPTAGQSWRWCNVDDEYGTGWHWHKIADSDAVKALAEASKAQATANSAKTSADIANDKIDNLDNLYASINHTHDDYLQLSGGTMTGSIILPGDDTMGLIPAVDNYGTIGLEDKRFYTSFITEMRSELLESNEIYGNNFYKNGLEFNELYSPLEHGHSAGDITGGTLALARIPTGTSSSTVARGDHSHSIYTTNATFTGHTSALSESGATGHVKIITGDVNGKTYTKGEAAAAAHTHSNYSTTSHNHDDRYYTETEINNLLASKSSTGHTHNNYSPTGHNHNNSYLQLSGGTMTGSIILPGDDTMGIIPQTNNYGTIGLSNKKFYTAHINNIYASNVYGATSVTGATVSGTTVKGTTVSGTSIYENGTLLSNKYASYADIALIDTEINYKIPKPSVTVGSATQPVYITSGGSICACTAYSSASVSSATNATNATNVYVTSNSTNTTHYLTFASGNTSENKALRYDSNLYYNPSSNTLTISSGKISANTITAATSMYSGAFYETSDERLKNFQDKIPVDLDKLSKLKKNYFTWKEKERGEKLEIGVSAQEIKELYPEIVSDEGETLSVAYDKLSVVALSAVDVLYEENKSLKNKISELEEQIKNINEFIKTLKK